MGPGKTHGNDDCPGAFDVPGYELIECIGKSASEVWLARERATDLLRAVKICDTQADSVAREELSGIRRYQQASHNHPHLVQILGTGTIATRLYCVMELGDNAAQHVAGTYKPLTLREKLSRVGRFDALAALQIVSKLADAADRLHAQGLGHNDIKPENIVFVDGEPKLVDVGLTASLASSGRRGTSAYMTPEGVADDAFALGRILHEMVTGLPPSEFPRLPPELLRHPSRLLRGAIALANRACSPDKSERFSAPRQLRDAARWALEPPPAFARCRAWWSRTPLAIRTVFGIGAVILLVVAIVVGLSPRIVTERLDLDWPQRLLVEPTKSNLPVHPYLHINGKPLAPPGSYTINFESPSEYSCVDYHVYSDRPWGRLDLGIAESRDGSDGVNVALMGQPGGEGLCVVFSSRDSKGLLAEAEQIIGHPLASVEYVIRIARLERHYVALVWPLARGIPVPIVREIPILDGGIVPKYITFGGFSHDPLARVEIRAVRVSRFPKPYSLEDLQNSAVDMMRYRPVCVPPLNGAETFPTGDLLSGIYHPYTSDSWMPIGAWAWWKGQGPALQAKAIQCAPFSPKKRTEYSRDSEGVFGGLQILRFDRARYRNFKASMKVRLAKPEPEIDPIAPFVSPSHGGMIGLAYGLDDIAADGCAWGSGAAAFLSIDPDEDIAPTAGVTEWKGLTLNRGSGHFASVGPHDKNELPVVERSDIGRDEVFDPDGFWLDIIVSGGEVRILLNSREILRVRDEGERSPLGRIGLLTSRIMATFESLSVTPIEGVQR